MSTPATPTAPIAFISYSHDSREHRQWVLKLATALMEKGIEVILDQWEVEPGDDLAAFMEQSVARANRVLMICTEAYVQKANDGKGGVGYEKTIVTGELINNVGTRKFIPVVRQTGPPVLPTALKSRLYVNLSDDKPFEEGVEELARTIHQAPISPKPPLGGSPYRARMAGRGSLPAAPPVSAIQTPATDPSQLYQTALQLARSGDQLAWRKLVQQIRRSVTTEQASWAGQQRDALLQPAKTSQERVLLYLRHWQPLFVVALAGVESGDPRFCRQAALIDELVNPSDWSLSGYTSVTELPHAAGLVYQALHGALAMQTEQLGLAQGLARTHVGNRYMRSAPVFKAYNLTGWNDALDGDCTVAWKFLIELPQHWSWLEELFGSDEEYRVSLAAYYMLLNVVDFFDAAASVPPGQWSKQNIESNVPIMYEGEAPRIRSRAYRVLVSQGTELRSVWESFGLKPETFRPFWQIWLEVSSQFVHRMFRFRIREPLAHTHLMDEIQF